MQNLVYIRLPIFTMVNTQRSTMVNTQPVSSSEHSSKPPIDPKASPHCFQSAHLAGKWARVGYTIWVHAKAQMARHQTIQPPPTNFASYLHP